VKSKWEILKKQRFSDLIEMLFTKWGKTKLIRFMGGECKDCIFSYDWRPNPDYIDEHHKGSKLIGNCDQDTDPMIGEFPYHPFGEVYEHDNCRLFKEGDRNAK